MDELKPTNEQCDRLVALTMDKLAKTHGYHAMHLNADVREHGSLRRGIVRTAYMLGAMEATQWVAVDERLPPEGVRVLVYVPTCELLPIQADEWNEQREDPTGMGGPTIATGHMWDEHEFEEVTHWQHFPAAPHGA